MAVEVTRDQVRAWRMRRQLLDPLGSEGAVEVGRRVCGSVVCSRWACRVP
jgi:hypothetical protein